MQVNFMNFSYGENEDGEKKKFQLTRGMLILGIMGLVVIIAVIIIIVSMLSKNKDEYTMADFKKLEERMVEESPIFLSQKGIKLGSLEVKILLEELLEENGGSINPNKVKAAKICVGYVMAVKNERETYTPYIKCKDLYTTKGYVDDNPTTTKASKDTTKPVITLKGDKEISIKQGTAYNEPGFTATDNVDGDVTASVKVEGTVDVNKEGTYTLKYVVTDKAGNRAEEIRKVTVLKEETTTHPTTTAKPGTTPKKTTTTKKITPVPKPSSPPSITLYGSRTVTINVGTSYKDPGYSARDSLGNDITSRVRVTSNVNSNATGTYYVSYSVTDSNGNSASTTRTVVVKSTYVELKGLSLTPNSVTLSVGGTQRLTVYFNPTNATNKNVSWSSSNTSVATVSSGVVTARSRGTAVITVNGADGRSASARITVK